MGLWVRKSIRNGLRNGVVLNQLAQEIQLCDLKRAGLACHREFALCARFAVGQRGQVNGSSTDGIKYDLVLECKPSLHLKT
jgi:hypothetical protein